LLVVLVLSEPEMQRLAVMRPPVVQMLLPVDPIN
jgi:hypothetical protein